MNNRVIIRCLATTLCCVGVGCKENNESTTAPRPVAADNTAKNKADRDANTKTPIDQSESSADVKITADIRREIMKTDMSTNAKNCKVMTENGVVTLRGPVSSTTEKDRIGALASSATGVVRVDNQLEIATP